MSKSLNTIQKCAKIFHRLVRVGVVLSIVGSVLGLAATMLWIRWNTAPTDGSAAMEQFMQLIRQGNYHQTLAALMAETIACAFAVPLLWNAHRYLSRELADGTPFTDEGATQLRRLGVLTIVLPILCIVLQAIPYSAFDLPCPDGLDNGGSVMLGVVLILVFVVFRYGAELAGGTPREELM